MVAGMQTAEEAAEVSRRGRSTTARDATNAACDRPGGGRQVDLEVVRMGLGVAIPSQLESGLAGSPLGNLREAGGGDFRTQTHFWA